MGDHAERFHDLYDSLRTQQGLLSRNAPVTTRAILSALTASGPPTDVAAAVLATESAIRKARPWYSALGHGVRVAIAATLVDSPWDADAFLDQLASARTHFRAVKLRRSETNEAFTMLVHAQLHQHTPITLADAQRFKSIYEACKDHHWWLTNAADLPACALLAYRSDTPEAIAAHTEAIYQALRGAGHSGGNDLQTASFFLTAAGGSAPDIAARFSAISASLRQEGLFMLGTDVDEIAILTALPQPVETIVASVLADREVLTQVRDLTRQGRFEIAASTTALSLCDGDEQTLALIQAKAMQDTYAIAMGQAAVAGGVAAAAT